MNWHSPKHQVRLEKFMQRLERQHRILGGVMAYKTAQSVLRAPEYDAVGPKDTKVLSVTVKDMGRAVPTRFTRAPH